MTHVKTRSSSDAYNKEQLKKHLACVDLLRRQTMLKQFTRHQIVNTAESITQSINQ